MYGDRSNTSRPCPPSSAMIASKLPSGITRSMLSLLSFQLLSTADPVGATTTVPGVASSILGSSQPTATCKSGTVPRKMLMRLCWLREMLIDPADSVKYAAPPRGVARRGPVICENSSNMKHKYTWPASSTTAFLRTSGSSQTHAAMSQADLPLPAPWPLLPDHLLCDRYGCLAGRASTSLPARSPGAAGWPLTSHIMPFRMIPFAHPKHRG